MHGGYERQQKQVAERTRIPVDCRRLQKFPEDAVGGVGAVARAAASAQVGDEIGYDRKCGQQRAGIRELPVARLRVLFRELFRQSVFQAADETTASRFSAHHRSPWRRWVAHHRWRWLNCVCGKDVLPAVGTRPTTSKVRALGMGERKPSAHISETGAQRVIFLFSAGIQDTQKRPSGIAGRPSRNEQPRKLAGRAQRHRRYWWEPGELPARARRGRVCVRHQRESTTTNLRGRGLLAFAIGAFVRRTDETAFDEDVRAFLDRRENIFGEPRTEDPFVFGVLPREASAPKASGYFMGGTRAVREEPGKQKPRSCRAQELARSSAQENERRKKSGLLYSARVGIASATVRAASREYGSKQSTCRPRGS